MIGLMIPSIDASNNSARGLWGLAEIIFSNPMENDEYLCNTANPCWVKENPLTLQIEDPESNKNSQSIDMLDISTAFTMDEFILHPTFAAEG